MPTAAKSVRIGDKAPSFSALDDRGEQVTLADFKGRVVVLYFYPKDDTPGCTIEACAFRDAFPQFEGLDAVILGVSGDSVKKHANFKKKYNLPFTLLADVDHEICNAYGVWAQKSMFGKKYMGILRTTFVIDRKGKIAKVFEKVSVANHADEVSDAIAELK
jgi:peroxiredoxin Q/BCP